MVAAVKHLCQGQSAKCSQNSFWLMNYEWADDLYGPLCTRSRCRRNIFLFIYFAFHFISFLFRIPMHINYKAGSIVKKSKKKNIENKRKEKEKKSQRDQPEKLKSSASEYFQGVGEEIEKHFSPCESCAPT